jgi:hypothetical protein
VSASVTLRDSLVRRPNTIDIPRGKNASVDSSEEPPQGEAEHIIRCPKCNGWVDCRDLGQVLEHEGPLPHPSEDLPR